MRFWLWVSILQGAFMVAACGSGEVAGAVDEDAGVEGEDAGPPDGSALDATDWNATFEEVFPDDHVVEIDLDLADGAFQQMINEWESSFQKNYFPSAFAHDGETLAEIGVRLKGYSSLLFGGTSSVTSKWPLKLNFNKFGGPRFKLIDRINLGNNVFDFSLMRERLGSRMFLAMGVPAARTAFANVTVDGNYLGIYSMVQQVDKRFLKQHYGEESGADEGNLYKCVPNERRTCSLGWLGSDPSAYHHSQDCNVGYSECGLVLKTNVEDPAKNDYSDLVAFLNVLNNTSEAEFAAEIDRVFEVDTFLRLAATSVVMSNFDSYFGRVNNFYLYHRPDTDKFTMIPWDLNMSYGRYGCGGSSMTQFPISNPKCAFEAGSIPLSDRILAVPEYHDKYIEYVRQATTQHFTVENQQAWIAEFDALLRPLVSQDPNYPGTLETYLRFLGDTRNQNGFQEGHHLMDFVKRRRASLLEQLPN